VNCALILQPPVNSSSLSFLTLQGRSDLPQNQRSNAAGSPTVADRPIRWASEPDKVLMRSSYS